MSEGEEKAWNEECNAVMREYFSRRPRIWETKWDGEKEVKTGQILVPVDLRGKPY